MSPSNSSCWLKLVVLVGTTVGLLGCGGGGRAPDPVAESLANMNSIFSAIQTYRQQHQDAWPDDLETIKQVMRDQMEFTQEDIDSAMTNPLTGDSPGYEYVKPSDEKPETVVLYQLRGGQRDTSLTATRADGESTE